MKMISAGSINVSSECKSRYVQLESRTVEKDRFEYRKVDDAEKNFDWQRDFDDAEKELNRLRWNFPGNSAQKNFKLQWNISW